MGSLYALKSFTGEVRVAEEDGFIVNQNGEYPVKKNQLIFTDLNGNEMVILKETLEKNFVEVKVKKTKRKLNKSLFELEQIAEAYGNVGEYIEKD